LNDFSVEYEINVAVATAAGMNQSYSELRGNIQECFNEAGIEIMSPNYFALRDGSLSTTRQAVAETSSMKRNPS
jgi:hypothetical protein